MRLALVMIGCLSLPGCWARTAKVSLVEGTPPIETVMTSANNGSMVSLKQGDTLVVKLDCTSGTGFVWEIAMIDERVLVKQGNPVAALASNKVIPGEAQTQVFRFTAKASGESILRMVYRRPFEKEVKSDGGKEFVATVRVP